MEQWAEVRRMYRTDGLSRREIYQRKPAGSKLDPFKDWICEQLAVDPSIQSQRLRELAGELGYESGKSISDDFVREVRPRFLASQNVPAGDLSTW